MALSTMPMSAPTARPERDILSEPAVNAIAPAFENVNFSAAAINYASVHALSFRCVAIASPFFIS